MNGWVGGWMDKLGKRMDGLKGAYPPIEDNAIFGIHSLQAQVVEGFKI